MRVSARRAPSHQQLRKLSKDETLLWEGAPEAWGVFRYIFRPRLVIAYFAVIAAWRIFSELPEGAGVADAVRLAAPFAVMAGLLLAFAAGLSFAIARTSRYVITDRRVIMSLGVAMPVTLNLPLDRVEGVALNRRADGSGDLALDLGERKRFAYLLLWPHAQPWRVANPRPALRCAPSVDAAAEAITAALAAAQDAKSAETAAADAAVPAPRPDVDRAGNGEWLGQAPADGAVAARSPEARPEPAFGRPAVSTPGSPVGPSSDPAPHIAARTQTVITRSSARLRQGGGDAEQTPA